MGYLPLFAANREQPSARAQSPDHGCRRALALAMAHTSDAVVHLGTRMAWQVR